MKRAALVALMFALVSATPAAGQHHGPAEAALVQRMTDCWNRFLESWRSWQNECVHPDSHYWGPQWTSPVNADFMRRYYALTYGTEFEYVLADLRPQLVSIHGDVATAYFNGSWAWRDADGRMHMQEDARLEVWLRQDGRWMLLRGMYVPVGGGS